MEYTRPISNAVDAFVETDILWLDKRYTSFTNNLWTDAYGNLDLRLGVRSDRFEALLYVDNVLDDDTVSFASCSVPRPGSLRQAAVSIAGT